MRDTPNILIVIGSTRIRPRGEPIARWLADLVSERDDLACDVVALASFRLPFLTSATPPMQPDAREEAAQEWATTIAAADGYVFVVPEYNHGYPAAVKNALDHLFSEWSRKPIGFVSYGGAGGGVRATEQLRQVAVELDMVPVRHQVAIARVWAAVDDNGELREPPVDDARLMLDDIAWWASALREARDAAERRRVRLATR
jgi:NAD(P)H-dependent FMN reductase